MWKKKKKKASAIKRIKKSSSSCGSAVYNPLITSGGYRFLSDGQR